LLPQTLWTLALVLVTGATSGLALVGPLWASMRVVDGVWDEEFRL
jgi:hypothetical protein